uniref:Glycosyltransferase n=1 Tax=Fagus sylvatica TaxID=28930 RepID=A0A2N9IVA1_FAGSY
MEEAIVLYPSPGRGHLISMVELGKLILKHHPSFSITILILSKPNTNTNIATGSDIALPQYVDSSTAQYIATVKTTTPSLTFHHLPPISEFTPTTSSPAELNYISPRLNNFNLHQALKTISQTSKLKAFIIDFFCDAAFEVSKTNLGIPTYYFFTSGASTLALFLYLSTFHKTMDKSFKDLNHTLLDIPGFPPVKASDMPKTMSDRSSKLYEFFLNTSTHMAKSNGLLVNSFELLETKAIKAISDGLCVSDGPTPPIFCIGPLILSSSNEDKDDDEHECLKWLNSQPSQSVSVSVFRKHGIVFGKTVERNGGGGFLERTKDRGFVVKEWAPQVAVLSHDSVGGFVTHCGWNSVLEAICVGVPMIAWPLYAEQRLNRVLLVEEMKVGLELKELEDGLVSGEELEKRVRELMESESEVRRAVRERASVFRDGVVAAVKEGGSSHVALAKLIELWRQD